MLDVIYKTYEESRVVFGMISLPERKFCQQTLAHASMASWLKVTTYLGLYLIFALQNKALH